MLFNERRNLFSFFSFAGGVDKNGMDSKEFSELFK
jgi:hypothetical protein